MENKLRLCSRCKKRVATVFVTHKEGENTVQEWLCLPCAGELTGNPVGDMLEKMGVNSEDLEHLTGELQSMMDGVGDAPSPEEDDGGAPPINLQGFFRNLGFPMQPSGNPGEKTGKAAKGKEEKPKYKFLETYCRNLTRRAAEGKMDTIVGRERELARVIQILSRRQKNNPCLIGEPGVGKTAIAEALAQKIVKGDVPYRLRQAEVYLVDLTAIVAGTQFRGQFESRILGLINDVKAAGNVILVIDEVHNIVGAGDAEGSMNAANIMKPALSRGEIQVIGATTLNEYRKYIEKDAALERRFQPVMVEEPSVAETVSILEGVKKYYEIYHGVKIPTAIAEAAARLSERYITDRFLPDKAIDLLDEAAAHVSLGSPIIDKRHRLADETLELKKQKEALETKADAVPEENKEEKEAVYKELAELKSRELQLQTEVEQVEKECASVALTVEDIAAVVEIWTGIPASSVSADEFERLDKLKDRLLTHIVGQDEAVSAVCRAIKRKRAGVSYHKAPVSFIFAGPTGVGKTELVKVLAEDLFKQPESLVRLDMSEFMEKFSVSRIIGAPPGYVGFDEAGQLTEKIRRRPYSVVLFDEIEKAHPDVLNILLQILDDGMVTDAHGKKVSFENTVIVMTTNAGAESGVSVSGFSGAGERADTDKTAKALSSFLRPEFLNRVDEIITFHRLTKENFSAIADIQMKKLKDALAEKNITLTYTREALAFIAEKSYSEKYGARNMRRFIQREIEDVLAEQIISHRDGGASMATVTVKDNALCVTVL